MWDFAVGYFCSIFLLFRICSTQNISQSEIDALYDLYSQTNGPFWSWRANEAEYGTKWNFSGNEDPCTNFWQGVLCGNDFSGFYISGLNLTGFNLVGSLNMTLADLSGLMSLNLGDNSITGNIPISLNELTSLTALDMGKNELSGEIPAGLCDLPNLVDLHLGKNHLDGLLSNISFSRSLVKVDLSLNRFEGSVSMDLVSLPNLHELLLAGNFLQGSIPVLSNDTFVYPLRRLDLSYNQLTGSLPVSLFTQNPDLRSIDLTSNAITGVLPVEIGSLQNLTDLIVFDNMLRGTVPSSIASMTSLRLLDIGKNQLTGSFPRALCEMYWLEILDIPRNRFNGTLPDCLGEMQALIYFVVTDNLFSGSLPQSLFTLQNVTLLDLGANQFQQPFPAEVVLLPSLRMLDIGSNGFTGTLPEAIGQLVNLEQLYIANNNFSGSLPAAVGNMSGLMALTASSCGLSGQIPAQIQNATRLLLLDLGNNNLTGTLPEYLSRLGYLDLDTNHYTGTLPASYGESATLSDLILYHNDLSGTIPCALSSLVQLQTLYLSANRLTGTLCDELFTAMPVLQKVLLGHNSLSGALPEMTVSGRVDELFMDFNQFTGPIPASYGALKDLAALVLSDNMLTSSLPSSLTNVSNLSLLAVDKNIFTGTLPSGLGRVSNSMAALIVNSNALSGSLPVYLGELQFLRTLLLHENKFTGRLSAVFSAPLLYLSNFDASTNFFTGAVPDGLFRSPKLTSFAAVSNCLGGSLPGTICNATALQVLSLSGIGTATRCRRPVFAQFMAISSYYLEHAISGSIPQCLLQMDKLEKLFVAGNGLKGALPAGNISASLLEVDFSNNLLTGTIPLSFQQKSWTGSFDLSVNRLDGTLSSSFAAVDANASIYLELNLLSGVVPASVVEADNVNVLSGNLFECSLVARSGLPPSDPNYDTYQCGSNTFYIALIVFGVAIVLALLRAYFMLFRQQTALSQFMRKLELTLVTTRKWLSVFNPTTNEGTALPLFGVFMFQLRQLSVGFGLVVLVIVTAVYVGIGYRYGVYTHAYAFTVSGAYDSGPTAAAVLFVMFTLFIFAFAVCSRRLFLKTRHVGIERLSIATKGSEEGALLVADEQGMKQRYHALLAGGTALNVVVVMGVNVAFVYISVTYSPIAVIAAQLGIAVFKLAWNELFVRRTFLLSAKYSKQSRRMQVLQPSSIPFLTVVYVFNSIVAPCIAIAIIAQDCFETAIFGAEPLRSTYTISTCSSWEVEPALDHTLGGVLCKGYSPTTIQADFTPPFHYSYHCASSVLQNYAAAFVELLLLFVVEPIFLMALRRVYYECADAQAHSVAWYVRRIVHPLLPAMFKPPPTELRPDKAYFTRDRFAMRIIAICSVMLTFGIVFPPIAVLALYAIAQYTYFEQLLIGCFITSAEEQGVLFLRHQIGYECTGVIEYLKQAFGILMQISGVVCSWFIFDTYGSEAGATSLAVAMIFMPRVVTLLVFFPQVVQYTSKGYAALRAAWWKFRANEGIDGKTLSVAAERGTEAAPLSGLTRDSSFFSRLSHMTWVSSPQPAAERESAVELSGPPRPNHGIAEVDQRNGVSEIRSTVDVENPLKQSQTVL